MEEKQANYYGILPANVRYSKISMSAKVLYTELSALSNTIGFCWASDSYFAGLYEVSRKTVNGWIKELKDAGFITVDTSKGSDGTKRKIFVTPVSRKGDTPVSEKRYTNNTSKNNKTNISFNEKEVLEKINATLGTRLRVLPRSFSKTIKSFTLEEIVKSLENLSRDAWHIERGIKKFPIDYLLRAETIQKFLEADSVQEKSYDQKFGKRLNLETMQYEEYEL